MKKFLAIALVCGLFSVTATFAQTATKAAPQKAAVAQTSSKAPATAKAETKPACTEAEMKACKDHGKKDASCCSKKAAGKSSCCMSGKTEAKAEDKDVKKSEKE